MAREYKIPVNSNVNLDTLTWIDKQVAAGDGGSRGEIIDKAVAAYREQKAEKKGASK